MTAYWVRPANPTLPLLLSVARDLGDGYVLHEPDGTRIVRWRFERTTPVHPEPAFLAWFDHDDDQRRTA